VTARRILPEHRTGHGDCDHQKRCHREHRVEGDRSAQASAAVVDPALDSSLQ
jgi:hypothetical protein